MNSPDFRPYERSAKVLGERLMRSDDLMLCEAEIASLQTAIFAMELVPQLYEALAPFAEFERVRSAMGGNTAKDGVLWAVNSSAGSAEITAEDLRRAIAALAKARGEANG